MNPLMIRHLMMALMAVAFRNLIVHQLWVYAVLVVY